jgi:hypothetical protein
VAVAGIPPHLKYLVVTEICYCIIPDADGNLPTDRKNSSVAALLIVLILQSFVFLCKLIFYFIFFFCPFCRNLVSSLLSHKLYIMEEYTSCQ